MLYAVSALLTAVVCTPLFGGYLLHRDMVSTPTSPLTAAAFGIDGSAPRAVPQDAVVAAASHLVDGGLLVASIIAVSLFAAGIGSGRMAQRLVPRAGRAGAVAAAVVAIWNPFVAERLLQGHWSLLVGYAVFGWIVCAVMTVHDAPTWRSWAVLAGLFAVAGLTPTGSVLALVVASTTWIGVARTSGTLTSGRSVAVVLLWVLTATPWLMASFFAQGVRGVGGAEQFAARAEPGLGTLGSVLGLGGIWNADAVPQSRTGWWALIATAALLIVVVGGCVVLFRQRTELSPVVPALGVLAAVTVLLITLAATGPGLSVVEFALREIPGAGLLRDTQKFVAAAIPFYALAAAAAAGWAAQRIPAIAATAAVSALVVAPLPDLAWGVGGAVKPIDYPADYAAVAERIGHSDPPWRCFPAK